MLHSNKITVLADNGQQVFVAADIELILNTAFDYDYSTGSRLNRYTDKEVCEMWNISMDELNRMKYTLSYEFCHNADGSYKFAND
jgi:hypothetical protein